MIQYAESEKVTNTLVIRDRSVHELRSVFTDTTQVFNGKNVANVASQWNHGREQNTTYPGSRGPLKKKYISPKKKARDGPLVAGTEKFVSISSNWGRINYICPRSLIGSSNETTTVISLRKVWFPSRHETTSLIGLGKAWLPSRQYSMEMRFSTRATRG